jgi:Fe-S-cluster-containing dehydrogenase component
VFRDLYRMQVARSLLVIDQDACVRCGHCAWSCAEVHGVSRLVRRGDKVVTRLDASAAGPASLLLPNTCQHCRHAACMIDCPTGAIGRDPEGEVFIRPELCTGCGNCAKACPWDNIQMAPRAPAPGLSVDVAVKCDLCRGYEAPACIEACPTEAVTRIDPARDIAEVAGVLGLRVVPGPGPGSGTGAGSRAGSGSGSGTPALERGAPVVVAGAASVALMLGALGWALQRSGGWAPGTGPGLAMGVLGGVLIAALAAYAAPKRLVRRAMRRRPAGARAALGADRAPRSRVRPHLVAHMVLGALAPACALAHAGARLPASPGGALMLALALTSLLGVAGAIVYRALPRRLTRLERRGALPEDLPAERDALGARLYREISGTGEAVKAAAAHIVLPYVRAPLGGLALALSGRSLAGEEARIQRRIDGALAGRRDDDGPVERSRRLEGLQPILRTAVELRALGSRRILTAALRAWLPLHIVAGAAVLSLLLLHAAVALLS